MMNQTVHKGTKLLLGTMKSYIDDLPRSGENLILCGFARGVKAGQRAFTLIELLIVIAIIAILASILMPVLNKAQQRAINMGAINDVRQLATGQAMYPSDNNNWLPPDESSEGRHAWVSGQMRTATQFGTEPSVNVAPYVGVEDYTNVALLLDPNFSVLGSFVNNAKVYLDPGDQSTWQNPGSPRYGRVRSFSMNCAFNYDFKNDGDFLTQAAAGVASSPYRHFAKSSDFVGISPSDVWLFIDEHPDSINDGCFDFQMPSGGLGSLTSSFIDMPAAYHNGACAFSYADTHADLHVWREPGIFPQVNWNVEQTVKPSQAVGKLPGNPDYTWFAAHTSVAMPPGSVWIPPAAQ